MGTRDTIVQDRSNCVDDGGIVLRNIHHVGSAGRIWTTVFVTYTVRRGGLRHLDHLIRHRHGLFGRALQAPRLGFATQRLHRVHHIHLLAHERLPQLHRPRQLLAHFLDHLRKPRDRLHVFVPGLLIELDQVIVFLTKRPPAPPPADRPRRSAPTPEAVRIQRDGRNQLLELGRRPPTRARVGRSRFAGAGLTPHRSAPAS